MTTDVTTRAAENVTLAAQLQPDTANALRALFESVKPLVTPGFHGPLDIDTLVGLPGSHLWFEDPTSVRVIRFTFDSDKVGFQGRYTLNSGPFPVEQGTFHCVPNNPAIGFAFIVLSPDGGAARAFPISGMVTDLFERITVLLLGDFAAGGQLVTRFSATRLI
jgi:hypothetical protein